MNSEDIKINKPHPEWRCGKCGKKYGFHEFTKLVEKNYESGRPPTCECGYLFSFDRWRLQDLSRTKIGDKDVNLLVSTVDLEINHGFHGKDLWYETMVFVANLDETTCPYTKRYETKEQAIDGHNEILKMIRDGNYIWNL